jgi:hypothetical protein
MTSGGWVVVRPGKTMASACAHLARVRLRRFGLPTVRVRQTRRPRCSPGSGRTSSA